MNALIRHHLHSLRQSGVRFASAPFAALANMVVIGVVLALPLGMYLLVSNVQSLASSIPTEPQISVFLTPGAAKTDVAALENRLRAVEHVRSVRFVSREAALASLKRSPGMADVISTLRENPLPDAYVVTLGEGSAAAAERLESELKGVPGIAHVQVDSAWVRRIDALLSLGRSAVILLSALLSLALVAVTFNTIRLQILTQREEIEVSKLIGATDAYVRRPFFYWGGLLGASGGLCALLLVFLAQVLLNRNLSGFGNLYGVELRLQFLPVADAALLLAFAALLGWVGTYLSVSRHLSRIQPR